MKNSADITDDALCVVEETTEVAIAEEEEAGNEGCQVRRKIEDYLERRRYKDELGDLKDLPK